MAMIPGWVYRPRAAVRAGIRPLLLLGVAAIGCVTPAAASGNVAVELVSRCEGEFWGVAVSGNYAYAVGEPSCASWTCPIRQRRYASARAVAFLTRWR